MVSHFILPKEPSRELVGVIAAKVVRALSALPSACAWAIEIIEYRPTRSSQQNRYLWGVVYATILKAGRLEGFDADDIHDYCLGEHFGWETLSLLGKKRIRPIRRSSKLNKQEFADYIAFIQQRMSEHGIFIPDADPEYFLNERAA